MNEIELHEKKNQFANQKKRIQKNVKSKKHFMNKVLVQHNDFHIENEFYTKSLIRQTVRYRDNRKHEKTSSKSTTSKLFFAIAFFSVPAISTKKKNPTQKKIQKKQKKRQTSTIERSRKIRRKKFKELRSSFSFLRFSSIFSFQSTNSPLSGTNHE